MDEKPIVVQFDVNSFQQWVRQGIIWISQDVVAALPICWIEGETNRTDSSNYAFLIQLPEKYRRALSNGQSIYALIDEAETVALPTQALTIEWQSRMKNLGEGWLPFEFKQDWIQSTSPQSFTDARDDDGPESEWVSSDVAPSPVEDVASDLSGDQASDNHINVQVSGVPGTDTEPAERRDAWETEGEEQQPQQFRQAEIPSFLLRSSEPSPQENSTLDSGEQPTERDQFIADRGEAAGESTQ